MSALLRIDNLDKRYAGGLQALKSVNLDIERGEIFALLGPNGAGKTTLINIICGIVKPTTGASPSMDYDTVRDFRTTRRHDRPGAAGALHRHVRDRARHGQLQPGPVRTRRPIRPTSRRVLRDLSLWDKRNHAIMTLSGGMKRRVLIAKALAHEPELLFLDEPTAGVDVELRRDMWRMIEKLRANRRDHRAHHPLHRGSRAHGRPRRRDPIAAR
jgi:ABC-2 type transport system ATP-binding protein